MKRLFSIITLIFNLFYTPFMPFSEPQPDNIPAETNQSAYIEEVTTSQAFNEVVEETTTAPFFEKEEACSEKDFSTTKAAEATTETTSFFATETVVQKNVSEETTSETTTESATKVASKINKLSDKTNGYTPEEDVVVLYEKINSYRAANGLNPLILDEELCQLAYLRAKEQETNEGHYRPDGTRFYTIFAENDIYYKTVGENIALSYVGGSERMFNGWKNSETHNENMLDSDWVKTGIALYVTAEGRLCYVQLFSTAK